MSKLTLLQKAKSLKLNKNASIRKQFSDSELSELALEYLNGGITPAQCAIVFGLPSTQGHTAVITIIRALRDYCKTTSKQVILKNSI